MQLNNADLPLTKIPNASMRAELSNLLARETKAQTSIDLYNIMYDIDEPNAIKPDPVTQNQNIKENGANISEVRRDTEKRFTFYESTPPNFAKDDKPSAFQVLRIVLFCV